jgi:DNA-binding transcriptional LysR family regulator
LSQSIKKLEKSVGAPLFARDMTGVSLTEAGKFLVVYARKMVNMRDEATRSISQLQSLKAGTLSVAAHESAELYLLPRPLKHFATLFPEVKLSVQRGALDEIPRKVLDREVQIGFVREASAFQELESVQVYVDEAVLIASPENELASLDQVSMQDLDGVSLIASHSRWAEGRVLRLFQQHSIQYRVVAELCSVESMKTMVMADVGVAIVPRITVLQQLREKKLVEISIPHFRLPLRSVMVFRKDGGSEPAERLIEIMRNKLFYPSLRPDKMEEAS